MEFSYLHKNNQKIGKKGKLRDKLTLISKSLVVTTEKTFSMLGNQKAPVSDNDQNDFGVPVDYEDAIQMLMYRYDGPQPENNEENLESYSIRAKKFKEIQFLRGTPY